MANADGCRPRCRHREHGIAVGDAAGCLVFGLRLNNGREQTELQFQALVWVLAEAAWDRGALLWATLPSMHTV